MNSQGAIPTVYLRNEPENMPRRAPTVKRVISVMSYQLRMWQRQGMLRLELLPTAITKKTPRGRNCAEKVYWRVVAKKLEVMLALKRQRKKKMTKSIPYPPWQQSLHVSGERRASRAEKQKVRLMNSSCPFRRGKVVVTASRTGTVTNCAAPLMSPSEKMFMLRQLDSSIGAYSQNITMKKCRLNFSRSIRTDSNLNRSTIVNLCPCCLLS